MYKSVQIFGQKIKIIYTKDLESRGELGLYDHIGKTIHIQTQMNGRDLDDDQLEATMWHELAHMMFSHLNYWEDNQNEQKVDQIGLALQQITKTLK